MDSLVSSWCGNVTALPPNYIMPPEKRPYSFSVCKEIPVLDLGNFAASSKGSRAVLLDQMINAGNEFGVFQVINHGISEEIMKEAMQLNLEFFKLPAKDRERFCSAEFDENPRLYTSGYNYETEDIHLWKDSLNLPCFPLLEQHIESWPQNPTKYRQVLGTYAREVKDLASRILDLICEGLGINHGYFAQELSKNLGIVVNHYPPCPQPNLALGIGVHCDSYLITLLQQDAYGLQITKKDGQWVGLDPHPNAFVVIIANQLEVISNGKLRSCVHRGVTNSEVDRMSIVSFIGPDKECVIGPAPELGPDPPRYKSYKFQEFSDHYTDCLSKKDVTYKKTMEPFQLQTNQLEMN